MSGVSNRVFIALGSNIEPREEFLRMAVQKLRTIGEVLCISPVYETSPVGEVAQPDFLNAVVEIQTTLDPLESLVSLKSFEASMGRKVRPRWHEREIDFDILFFNDIVLVSPALTIPHLEIPHRAFVLKPMSDLDANFVHPVLHRTIQELLSAVDFSGIRRTSIKLD